MGVERGRLLGCARRLTVLRHYPLVHARQVPHLSRRDPFEQRMAGAVRTEAEAEWEKAA